MAEHRIRRYYSWQRNTAQNKPRTGRPWTESLTAMTIPHRNTLKASSVSINLPTRLTNVLGRNVFANWQLLQEKVGRVLPYQYTNVEDRPQPTILIADKTSILLDSHNRSEAECALVQCLTEVRLQSSASEDVSGSRRHTASMHTSTRRLIIQNNRRLVALST
jgi:hypothetical protein